MNKNKKKKKEKRKDTCVIRVAFSGLLKRSVATLLSDQTSCRDLENALPFRRILVWLFSKSSFSFTNYWIMFEQKGKKNKKKKI